MPLRFHGRVFEILREVPRERTNKEGIIAAIEANMHQTLPPSLREWYALDSACRFIGEHVPIEQVGAGLELNGERFDLVKSNLLPIVVHSEGFCLWAVLLDGSEDPPVMVDPDATLKKWVRYAAHFSEFVLSRAFDRFTVGGPLLAQSDHDRPSDQDVALISNQLQRQVSTTGWPTEEQIRFGEPGRRVLIECEDAGAAWWLAADSEAEMNKLVSGLRSIKGLLSRAYSDDPIVKPILEHHSKLA